MSLFAMAGEGVLIMSLFLVFCIIAAVSWLLEEMNKGRKQKQRDKEWNELNKPE